MGASQSQFYRTREEAHDVLLIASIPRIRKLTPDSKTKLEGYGLCATKFRFRCNNDAAVAEAPHMVNQNLASHPKHQTKNLHVNLLVPAASPLNS